MEHSNSASAFAGLIDLVSRKTAETLLASDEFFAAKENLLKEGREYLFRINILKTENGWTAGNQDGREVPGFDWCIIKPE